MPITFFFLSIVKTKRGLCCKIIKNRNSDRNMNKPYRKKPPMYYMGISSPSGNHMLQVGFVAVQTLMILSYLQERAFINYIYPCPLYSVKITLVSFQLVFLNNTADCDLDLWAWRENKISSGSFLNSNLKLSQRWLFSSKAHFRKIEEQKLELKKKDLVKNWTLYPLSVAFDTETCKSCWPFFKSSWKNNQITTSNCCHKGFPWWYYNWPTTNKEA